MSGAPCVYCGNPVAPHLDHVVPASRGGRGLGADNLARACVRCNGSKGGRTPEEWLRSESLQARVAKSHLRRGHPGQMCLDVELTDWWRDCRVAIDSELWQAFGRACSGRDQGRHSAVSRSVILREFIRWYVGDEPNRPNRPVRTAEFGD